MTRGFLFEEELWRKTSIYKRGSLFSDEQNYTMACWLKARSSTTWLVPFPAEEGINLQKSYKANSDPASLQVLSTGQACRWQATHSENYLETADRRHTMSSFSSKLAMTHTQACPVSSQSQLHPNMWIFCYYHCNVLQSTSFLFVGSSPIRPFNLDTA